MEKEAIAIDMINCTSSEAQDGQNASAWSLFAKIRSAASKVIAKILRKNQPSMNLEPRPPPPPPEVPVVALRLADATEEEQYSRIMLIPSSPERKLGLQHPVFKMILEQKMGKSVLNIGVPTAIAVLVSGGSIGPKTLMVFTYIMVSGLCIGCVAIWNGILLRETFPRQANVMELLGIVLVLICLSGVVGSYLLGQFVWLPILCGSWCLFPFIIMILPCMGRAFKIVI